MSGKLLHKDYVLSFPRPSLEVSSRFNNQLTFQKEKENEGRLNLYKNVNTVHVLGQVQVGDLN